MDNESKIPENITLRDYFAGQALSGLVAAYSHTGKYPSFSVQPRELIEMAYQMADLMIEKRKI